MFEEHIERGEFKVRFLFIELENANSACPMKFPKGKSEAHFIGAKPILNSIF